jgi:hypothetical protein
MHRSLPAETLAARVRRAQADQADGRCGGVIGNAPCRSSVEALERVYRRFGGLQTGQVFSQQLRRRLGQGADCSLMGRVAAGRMFGWTWQDDFWVPLFQVDRDSLAVRPASRRVLAELGGVFDGWALAQWFAQPSTWLRGCRPVELLAKRPAAVVLAARGDRVIAGG